MNFDLDSLSLDLDVPSSPGGNESAESATGSHATKLALAEEFVSIGDDDGARALIEEVIADASGPLLEQARAALARLN